MMNLSFDLVLNKNRIRQSIEQYVRAIPRITTGVEVIPRDRLTERLALWQIIQDDIVHTLKYIWEYIIKHNSLAYVLFCMSTSMNFKTDCKRVKKWMNQIESSNKRHLIHVDIPSHIFYRICSYLTASEIIKYVITQRLIPLEWDFYSWQKKIYGKLLQIKTFSLVNMIDTWSIILNAKRLTWLFVFDSRLTDDKCLDQLLLLKQINPDLGIENLWTNVHRPLICGKYLIDEALLKCVSYVNSHTYINFACTCRYLWRQLRKNQFQSTSHAFNTFKLSQNNVSKWHDGKSSTYWWWSSNIFETLVSAPYDKILPLRNFQPKLLTSYIGDVFILSNFNNGYGYPHLKVVIRDCFMNMDKNHCFNKLEMKHLKHFIVLDNRHNNNQIHTNCDIFTAAGGVVTIDTTIKLFNSAIVKVVSFWCNISWEFKWFTNTHLNPPPPYVPRDKHILWIGCSNWCPLFRFSMFKYFTHCVSKFTLIGKWNDILSLIGAFLCKLGDINQFPVLSHVTILLVHDQSESLFARYKVLCQIWDWIEKNFYSIKNRQCVKSWIFGLYVQNHSDDNADILDICNIDSINVIDKHKHKWFRMLLGLPIRDSVSITPFVYEWNKFVNTWRQIN